MAVAFRHALRSSPRQAAPRFACTYTIALTLSLRLHRAMASVASAPPREDAKAFFPDEPQGPSIKTEIPGPTSKAAIDKLDRVFDTRALNMMGDYTKSYGN